MTLLHTLRRLDRPLLARRRDGRRVLVDSRTAVNYEMVAPVVRAMAADERVQFAFTASEEPRGARPIYAMPRPARDASAPAAPPSPGGTRTSTSDFMWATLPRGAAARSRCFTASAASTGSTRRPTSMRQWDRLFFVNERRLRNFVRRGRHRSEGRPAAR